MVERGQNADVRTLGLGLRYEYWHEKSLRAGNGATFDPAIGKVIAGVDDDGSVNLSQQPVSPFLSASSQGLWVPANEVGVPNGLFKASGNFSPRIGITWRPEVLEDLAARGMSIVALDVTDPVSIEACRQKVESITSGRLDVLVNNA